MDLSEFKSSSLVFFIWTFEEVSFLLSAKDSQTQQVKYTFQAETSLIFYVWW